MKKQFKNLMLPIILVAINLVFASFNVHAQVSYLTGGSLVSNNNPSNSNVGINNAKPMLKLHLKTSALNDGMMIEQTGLGTQQTFAALRLKSGHDWGIVSTGAGNISEGANHLGFYDYTSGSYRLFINGNNGNVGIGTVNPLAKLHVDNGAIRITGPNPEGGPMILFGGSSVVAPGGEWGIEYTTAAPGHDGLNFWRPFGATGGGGNSFLFLHNNGRVGINTDNPTAQFTVNGNMLIGDPSTVTLPAGYKLYVETGILTEKVKVAVKNSFNWADYVFASDYKLMPLKSIKKYVEINKHLPNVPSAKDLEKQGLDLGAMAAMQMEKIEELTLHLIQINERLEILEKENAALKNTAITSPAK